MGKLIVLDALDGAGKETQTKELLEKMYQKGEDVIAITFPNYSSPSSYGVQQILQGKLLVDDPYQVSSIYSNDRLLSMNSYIKSLDTTLMEFYNEGGTIIADRYTTSNMFYQTENMSEYELDEYMKWLINQEYNILKLPKPDLVLFLDVPPDIAIDNVIKRNMAMDIYENEDKLRNVYNNIPRLIKYIDNFEKIECTVNNSMRSVNEISEIIIGKVEAMND